MSELTELKGKSPGFREKVVLLWVKFLHGHESEPKEVFPGENIDSRIVIDFLV